MKEVGAAADLVFAAAVRLVGVSGVTDSEVAALLGRSGVGAPIRVAVEVRRRLAALVSGSQSFRSYPVC